MPGELQEPTPVLLAAAGAGWETVALRELGAARVVVVKRCVDLPDLVASATAGQAEVAVVAADLPGLDASAVLQLLRHDVRTVAVGDEGLTSLGRIGVVEVIPESEVQVGLGPAVRRAATRELVADPEQGPDLAPDDPDASSGRVVAVWGPAGAPGRTTIALGMAAELAHRGRPALLADLDPYGGSVAQQLGVLDEVSGLLSAARLANAGELDRRRFAACRRQVTGPGPLQVLTGLPRPDRWVEVREGVVGEILELAASEGQVLADTGFCLEDAAADLGRAGGGRNRMTLDAVSAADEVVVVGSADPVGLSRLARGLVELGEACPGSAVRVVVNRMRETLGWQERDIVGMVEGFARPLGVHFLAEDQPACDRALVAGKALSEGGDSALRRGIADLVDVVFGARVEELAPRHHLARSRRSRLGRVRRGR